MLLTVLRRENLWKQIAYCTFPGEPLWENQADWLLTVNRKITGR
jgi:hypothetical protein